MGQISGRLATILEAFKRQSSADQAKEPSTNTRLFGSMSSGCTTSWSRRGWNCGRISDANTIRPFSTVHLQMPPLPPPANDVVEAALRDNGNKPLTARQSGSLMLNLRYRAAFIGNDTMKKLEWSNTGRIEPKTRNVAAVAEGLQKLALLDFGVPPRF